MKLPVTLRALRHRNFRLFFGGQLISLVGTWMQNIAQAWLVYRMTHSSTLLGAVGFAGQIPIFLLAWLGGIAADRYNRRDIVIATQAASMLLAFTLAAFTLTGTVQIWEVFVLASLLGITNAFDIPARQSFFVEMVGREDLMNAIALNSSMFNASRVLGPAVAAILLTAIGEGWCFFANGLSFLAVIAGLLMMDVRRRPPAKEDPPLAHVVEGFRYVIHNPPVHIILMLLGAVSLAGVPYNVLMPIFADSVLHGGARALGELSSVAGVGALLGALLLATRRDVGGLGRWVAAAALGFGASLIAFSFSRHLWLSALLLIPVGFCIMLQMGSSNTLLQTMVPDRLRGRVMAVYSMMIMGMAPIGSLASGAAATRFGAPATVAASGILCTIAALLFRLRLPAIHTGVKRLIVAQEMAAAGPPQESAGLPPE
ncbi:MAG TPA: MFS transporter [Bryobacteraceae bacterium]|nr:MFS transporter [Bryobacteraceae bacterium]